MEERKRIRDLGIEIGRYKTGKHNAITDIPGVKVGHKTLVWGDEKNVGSEGIARTGVTTILPNDDMYNKRIFASGSVINGVGEVSGMIQVKEWGVLETPIALTNTMNVGLVADGIIEYMSSCYPLGKSANVVIPVVGECNDGGLNDATKRHVKPHHVVETIESSNGGAVEEGCVGAGTGMSCFDFKGGIGTSSRLVANEYTIGVMVLSNFGDRYNLKIDGVPVGREITELMPKLHVDGSIIVVIGTDAPLLPHQLNRIARRASLGLGKVGSCATHGSGEIVFTFATGNTIERSDHSKEFNVNMVNDEKLNPLFEATVECVEEAVLNSIFMADTMEGINGNTFHSIPIEKTLEIMKKYNRL